MIRPARGKSDLGKTEMQKQAEFKAETEKSISKQQGIVTWNEVAVNASELEQMRRDEEKNVDLKLEKEKMFETGSTLHNVHIICDSDMSEKFLAAAEPRPSIIHQGDIHNQRK